MGDALRVAYTEYLERMFDESMDIVQVDADTVPDDANLAVVGEWADVG